MSKSKTKKWNIFSWDWWTNTNQEETNIKRTTRDLVEWIKKDNPDLINQNKIIRLIEETIIADRNLDIEEHKRKIKDIETSLNHLSNGN